MSRALFAILFGCSLMLAGCSETKDGGTLPQEKSASELEQEDKAYEAKMKEAMQGGPQKSESGD